MLSARPPGAHRLGAQLGSGDPHPASHDQVIVLGVHFASNLPLGPLKRTVRSPLQLSDEQVRCLLDRGPFRRRIALVRLAAEGLGIDPSMLHRNRARYGMEH